jgi:hypothetical protein
VLSINVTTKQGFDESTNRFVALEAFNLELEHSLVSLSKWEAFWEKPFLGKDEKTDEQTISYIRDMTLTPMVPEGIYSKLKPNDFEKINDYISKKMTATWFAENKSQKNDGSVITSELIYYWMVALNIPFECQHWHLNRLLTLIRVCNEKNQPAKKMSRRDLAAKQREIAERRRQQYGTRG